MICSSYQTQKEADGTQVILWTYTANFDSAQGNCTLKFERHRQDKDLRSYEDELLITIID